MSKKKLTGKKTHCKKCGVGGGGFLKLLYLRVFFRKKPFLNARIFDGIQLLCVVLKISQLFWKGTKTYQKNNKNQTIIVA